MQLVVNNKSLLRQSRTAGTYHHAAQTTLSLLAACRISLKLSNENESSADCAVVYWWKSGSQQPSMTPVGPVSLDCARPAVKQSDADAVETLLWTVT